MNAFNCYRLRRAEKKLAEVKGTIKVLEKATDAIHNTRYIDRLAVLAGLRERLIIEIKHLNKEAFGVGN